MAIIGPFSSGECRVAFPAGERAGVVTMSMASSAPKLAEPFTYGLRNTSDEGYMFRNVMKTLKDKKYAIATGAVAYATDDVISKTMGEIVLPNIMKASGTEMKAASPSRPRRSISAAQVSQLKATPTDLIGVGSGPDAASGWRRRCGGKATRGGWWPAPPSPIPNWQCAWARTAMARDPDDVLRRGERQGEEVRRRVRQARQGRRHRADRRRAVRRRRLRYRDVLRARDEGSQSHRRSGQARRRADRGPRHPALDAALPGARRADLVRQERRRAQARLHHRDAGRKMEPDRHASPPGS